MLNILSIKLLRKKLKRNERELENVFSMQGLAIMYYEGNGVEQNYEKAKEWIEKYEEAEAE